jgi:hypothetical protein
MGEPGDIGSHAQTLRFFRRRQPAATGNGISPMIA